MFINRTPMIQIALTYKGELLDVYAKVESFNFTGSIKDRIVSYIICKAIVDRTICVGDTIVEATSGNTGISVAAVGRAFGHKVKIIIPDTMSEERKQLIKGFGAELIVLTAKDGGYPRCVQMAREMGAEDGYYTLNQHENLINLETHYMTTGKEILKDLPDINAFVAGVGTGGTFMGVGKRLKEELQDVDVHPLDVTSSSGGLHKVQGLANGFMPDLVDFEKYEEKITVNDTDSLIMAQRLSKELGLGVGISSGANFLGAVQKAKHNKKVVTVFPDDNKKYLSTDLMRDLKVEDNHISKDIELLGFLNVVSDG